MRRRRGDGVQNLLTIGWRRGDDTQHVGSGRLLLQGLPQIGVALLQIFKEPGGSRSR